MCDLANGQPHSHICMCVASEILEIPVPALMPHGGVEDARLRALQRGMARMLWWALLLTAVAGWEYNGLLSRSPGISVYIQLNPEQWAHFECVSQYVCKVVTFTERLRGVPYLSAHDNMWETLSKVFTSFSIVYSISSNPWDVCALSKEHSNVSHVFILIQGILIVTSISISDKHLRPVSLSN